MLSPEQVDQFVEDGFVRIDQAFPQRAKPEWPIFNSRS
jgi:hypothetical protein